MQIQICRLHINVGLFTLTLWNLTMESKDGQFITYLHFPAMICSKANHGQMEALKYWLNDPQVPWRKSRRRTGVGSEKKATIRCHVLYNK